MQNHLYRLSEILDSLRDGYKIDPFYCRLRSSHAAEIAVKLTQYWALRFEPLRRELWKAEPRWP